MQPIPLLHRYRYHEEGFVFRPVTFTDETPFGLQLTFQSVFTLIRAPVPLTDELAAPANFRISCGRRKFFAILKLSLTIERAISMVDKSREHAGVRPNANYVGWIENIKRIQEWVMETALHKWKEAKELAVPLYILLLLSNSIRYDTQFTT